MPTATLLPGAQGLSVFGPWLSPNWALLPLEAGFQEPHALLPPVFIRLLFIIGLLGPEFLPLYTHLDFLFHMLLLLPHPNVR